MYLTCGQCAKLGGVTKGAVYMAIRIGRLKYVTCVRGWKWILKSDYLHYMKSKYIRPNPPEGLLTVKQCAKFMKISIWHVYYMIEKKKIKFDRKSHAYMIRVEDAIEWVRNNRKK